MFQIDKKLTRQDFNGRAPGPLNTYCVLLTILCRFLPKTYHFFVVHIVKNDV